jgi:hypothetical protein
MHSTGQLEWGKYLALPVADVIKAPLRGTFVSLVSRIFRVLATHR